MTRKKTYKIYLSCDSDTYDFINTISRKLVLDKPSDVILFAINLLRIAYQRGLLDNAIKKALQDNELVEQALDKGWLK